jgi:hypothetical protein
MWVPCQHDMVLPQVEDGRYSLQLWEVAANILNEQPRTADEERSSNLGAGNRVHPSPQKVRLLRNFSMKFGLG